MHDWSSHERLKWRHKFGHHQYLDDILGYENRLFRKRVERENKPWETPISGHWYREKVYNRDEKKLSAISEVGRKPMA